MQEAARLYSNFTYVAQNRQGAHDRPEHAQRKEEKGRRLQAEKGWSQQSLVESGRIRVGREVREAHHLVAVRAALAAAAHRD